MWSAPSTSPACETENQPEIEADVRHGSPCRGKDIVCGQIDIGNAATPLTERMVQGQGVLQPDGRMMIEPRMNADNVGRAVVYMANLPLDTNVLFMTVMANQMPFVGRGQGGRRLNESATS